MPQCNDFRKSWFLFLIIALLQTGLRGWLWTWAEWALHGKSLTAYEETTDRISFWCNCKIERYWRSKFQDVDECRDPQSCKPGERCINRCQSQNRLQRKKFLKYKSTLQHDWIYFVQPGWAASSVSLPVASDWGWTQGKNKLFKRDRIQ